MLSNAYFLAKFRFDTAENEPAKIMQNLPILLTDLSAALSGSVVRHILVLLMLSPEYRVVHVPVSPTSQIRRCHMCRSPVGWMNSAASSHA